MGTPAVWGCRLLLQTQAGPGMQRGRDRGKGTGPWKEVMSVGTHGSGAAGGLLEV